MGKIFRYAFVTCTTTYLIVAFIIFILAIIHHPNWITSETRIFVVSSLTLALSEFSWWGHFYYLAVLVPWLGSSLLIVVLLAWSRGRMKPRFLPGGISAGAYYLAMFLAFIFAGLFHGWGDIAYPLLLIWPLAGFAIGCLSAWIADKIIKFAVFDQP
jgi:hypothetical protein